MVINTIGRSDIIGYWPLSEGTGSTAYDSTGSYNGTITGADWNSKINNGANILEFVSTNSDNIDCGNITETNGVTAMTVSIWATPSFNTGDPYSGIISKRVDNTHRWEFGQSGTSIGDNDDIFVVMANGANTYGYTTSDFFLVGSWYHLVMVYDGSGATNADKLKFYVNGVQETLTYSGTIPSTTPSNSSSVTIGLGNGNYYDGSINDAIIYNRALSLSEIKSLYRSTYRT